MTLRAVGRWAATGSVGDGRTGLGEKNKNKNKKSSVADPLESKQFATSTSKYYDFNTFGFDGAVCMLIILKGRRFE